MIEEIQKLIEKHELKQDQLAINPFELKRAAGDWAGLTIPYFQKSKEREEKFLTHDKYERVEPGWYGFDLYGIPAEWFDALEDFYQLLLIHAPDFKILQWKLKFGGIRLYSKSENRLAHEAARILEEAMTDKNLIY